MATMMVRWIAYMTSVIRALTASARSLQVSDASCCNIPSSPALHMATAAMGPQDLGGGAGVSSFSTASTRSLHVSAHALSSHARLSIIGRGREVRVRHEAQEAAFSTLNDDRGEGGGGFSSRVEQGTQGQQVHVGVGEGVGDACVKAEVKVEAAYVDDPYACLFSDDDVDL